jgi:2-polyprenyl-3-methyl-5-hydroxy-6-metoxy-1,4-benzoquinol methylase
MQGDDLRRDLNDDVRSRWDGNARFWDEQMGAEGNDFHLDLVRPAVERLLGGVDGQRVLEVACGNGLFARRLVELGADVVATDASPAMLERAREHPSQGIEYQLLDAADPGQLAALGDGGFDAVVCNMALMDMADVGPLAMALRALLAPSGRFVFSTVHPCFNSLGVRFVHEVEEPEGELVERRGVLITRYVTAAMGEGTAILGQPVRQLYFDRPLGVLLGTFFACGLALDGLEEPAFPPGGESGQLHWGALPEIPPVLVGSIRPVANAAR